MVAVHLGRVRRGQGNRGFEKRLAQSEARLILTWCMFLFWVGQVAAVAGFMAAMLRMFGFWAGQVVAVAGLMVAMFQFFLR